MNTCSQSNIIPSVKPSGINPAFANNLWEDKSNSFSVIPSKELTTSLTAIDYFYSETNNVSSTLTIGSIYSPNFSFESEGTYFDSVKKLDYFWENYSGNSSIIRYYVLVKNYENKYKMSSEKLVNEWKSGKLQFRNEYINDWLSNYLQIRDFINEKNEKE